MSAFFNRIDGLLAELEREIREARAEVHILNPKGLLRWLSLSQSWPEIEQCKKALASLRGGDRAMKSTATQVVWEFLCYRDKEARNNPERRRRIEEVEREFREYLGK